MSNSLSKIKFFNDKWDDNEQEEWNKIINRFLVVIDKYLSDWWCEFKKIEWLEQEFCYYMGLKYQKLEPEEQDNPYQEYPDLIFNFKDTNLYIQITSAHDNKSLAKVLQYMFIVLEKEEEEEIKLKENLSFGTELELLELTPLYEEIKALAKFHKCFSITKVQNSVTIYPSGSPLLDEQVINKTLEGLEDHPKISEYFERALKKYELAATDDYSEQNYRDIQDNLRIVIEQLLKEILKNDKSLENQKEELGRFLRNKKVSTEIRNMLIKLLFIDYTLYQNNNVKHRDNAEKQLFTNPEVEFIIYLTGTIMRFLTQINKIK
ncbi:hypothetical protein [Kamptonema sp. UHCC 0994]|uniref:hypothetical protein n=1 Tax=Kamptonema sp. UHCC 0994 TaxID=3031329 RepID=UPI0023B9FB4D|nr:hypothetical protein [Kamptonema sp. UHCC 0994]MDF0552505.1 hypothetical protein [Kamptonema sp. UHCC 0994]